MMTNPLVKSRGSFTDKHIPWKIDVGETKELPDGWQDRVSINQALKNGMLSFVTPDVKVSEPVKGKNQIIKAKMEEPDIEVVGEEEIKKDHSDISPLADDYLGRNATTVRKAIASDDLDKKFLKDMEKLEKKGKKRKSILDSIRRKLIGE